MSKLTNNELDQINYYFINTGTSQSPVVVERCLFLSVGAKQLYSNLCQYMFGNKKSCFPSQSLLMLELGIAPATLNKYLDELRDQELITTEKHFHGTLEYTLEEVWKPFCLHHSEWVWRIIDLIRSNPELRNRISTKQIKKTVDDYKRSTLYNSMLYEFGDIKGEHVQRLCDWFGEKFGVRIKSIFNDWKVTFSIEA